MKILFEINKTSTDNETAKTKITMNTQSAMATWK